MSSSSCASSSGCGWRAGCSSCGWFPDRRSERRLWSSPMTLKSCSDGNANRVLYAKAIFCVLSMQKLIFPPQSGCALLYLLSDVFGLNCKKMMRNKVGPVLNNKFLHSTHTGNILDTTVQQICNKSHIYEAFKLHMMLKSRSEQFFPLKFPLWTVYSHEHTALYFVHSKHLVLMSTTNL